MKTTKTKSTIKRFVSNEDANNQFKKAVSSKEGANNFLASFLIIADRVVSTRRSFTFQNFVSDGAVFEIPYSDLKDMFDRWTEILIQGCRLEVIEGIDSNIYIKI